MATKACSPYPEPRFMASAREENEILGEALKQAEADGLNVQKRDGFDKRHMRWASNQLKVMLPMSMDKFVDYGVKQGWWAIKDGKIVNKAMKDGMEGAVSAVMKDYLIAPARGIKQLGDNFLLKARSGEDAVVEGMKFAKQLRQFGQIGESILGFDQSYGRSMRAQMLRGKRQIDGVVTEVELTPAEAAAAQNDVLTGIATRLQDPATANEALSDLMQVAEMIQFVDDPMAITRAGLGMNFVGDAWKEWTMNSLLSSPDTWLANASGALWVPFRAFSQLGGSVLLNAVDPGEAKTVWAQSVAQLAAMRASLTDATTIAWNGMKQNRFMYADPEGKITRSISGANAAQFAQNNFGVELSDGVKSVIDGIGFVVNIPGRLLMATDEFAKHIALRGEVANRGVRKAIESGIDMADTEAIEAFLKKEVDAAFMLDPDTGSKWLYSPAYDQASTLDRGGRAVSQVAREGTFQEQNAVADWASKGPGMQGVLKPMIPFVRTPLNILTQGIRDTTIVGPVLQIAGALGRNKLSPAGAILDLQKRLLADPAESARVAGQITFMSGLLGMLWMKTQSGEATGGGPRQWMDGPQSRGAQQAWERNNTPYSLVFGDVVIPFSRFPEPMATLMRMTSDVGMASAYLSQEERDDVMGTLVGVGVAGLYSSSMLQGIDQFISTFQDASTFDQRAGGTVQQWFATQTPLGGMMSYVDRIQDPYRSAYQAPSLSAFFTNFEDVFGYGVLGRVADRFPGAGQRPLQIDQLAGEPVPIYPGVGPGGLNPALQNIPMLPRKRPSDPVWQAVFDMAGGWEDYTPDGIDLTLTEQMDLNGRMARHRIGGRTLAQRLMELRRRPDVEIYVRNKGMGDPGIGSAIRQEVNRLKREYGRAALNQMQRGSVSLTQRAALRQTMRGQQRANDIRGARVTQQRIDQLLEDANRGF